MYLKSIKLSLFHFQVSLAFKPGHFTDTVTVTYTITVTVTLACDDELNVLPHLELASRQTYTGPCLPGTVFSAALAVVNSDP